MSQGWKDDALPEFGPFEIDELKEGMVFWDLHLLNTPMIGGRTCSRKRAAAHQALVMAAKGAAVYTLAQRQALVRQGRVSEGQAADTHTSWIQLHGTGVCPALTALGGNFVCKS